MFYKSRRKQRLFSLIITAAILLVMLPMTAVNAAAAGVAISSVEVTQIMGKGIDLESGKYYFMNMFVAGKPTAIQVVMADVTNVDSAKLDIYYEGSLLTTAKPSDTGERQIFAFVPGKNDVNGWKAGRYKFTVTIGGESKTTEAIFNDSRTFSMLVISASVRYDGTIYEAPDVDANTIPLRSQALPVSENKLIAKYRNAKVSFGTGQNGYDISTPEGHMNFLADVSKYRAKSAASYDVVVAVVNSPLGGPSGYTDNEHSVVITLHNSGGSEKLGSILLHELGHIFGNGDEYSGGEFKMHVNGAPCNVSGYENGESVTGNKTYLTCAPGNNFSGILIHDAQNPYNPKAKTSMLNRSSFMGSSYDHWTTSMVWEAAYKRLVPNYQNVLPRVYTDGTIVAKRTSKNDLAGAEMNDYIAQYRAMLNEVRAASGLAPYKEDDLMASGDKRLLDIAEEVLQAGNLKATIDTNTMIMAICAETKLWFEEWQSSTRLYEFNATTIEEQRDFFTLSPCGQSWIKDDYMFLSFVRADNAVYYTWTTATGPYVNPYADEDEYEPQPESPPIPEVNPVSDDEIDPVEYVSNNGHSGSGNVVTEPVVAETVGTTAGTVAEYTDTEYIETEYNDTDYNDTDYYDTTTQGNDADIANVHTVATEDHDRNSGTPAPAATTAAPAATTAAPAATTAAPAATTAAPAATTAAAPANKYASISKDERIKMLKYDSIDMGMMSARDPDGASYTYGFYAWYANENYGLNITAEQAERAISEGYKAGNYDGMGEHPHSETSRFSLLCITYKLYPTKEMRDEVFNWSFVGGYMPFGESPKRAKGDTEPIDDSYYYQNNGGDSNDDYINDPDGDW